jgi:hypothetical protein
LVKQFGSEEVSQYMEVDLFKSWVLQFFFNAFLASLPGNQDNKTATGLESKLPQGTTKQHL